MVISTKLWSIPLNGTLHLRRYVWACPGLARWGEASTRDGVHWQTSPAAVFTLCTFVPMMGQIQTPLQEHLVTFVASILVILITVHPRLQHSLEVVWRKVMLPNTTKQVFEKSVVQSIMYANDCNLRQNRRISPYQHPTLVKMLNTSWLNGDAYHAAKPWGQHEDVFSFPSDSESRYGAARFPDGVSK